MRRYIITGTPGAGKTVILDELAARGYPVVPEAATDVIAREHAAGRGGPWRGPDFIDKIVTLQRQRLDAPGAPTGRAAAGRAAAAEVQLHDRSALCTLALAHYAEQPVSRLLAAEVDRVLRERVFDRRVFFVRQIGFVTPTLARRITFEQSLLFERIHDEVYRGHGFDLVEIPPGPVAERADAIESWVRSWSAVPR